MKLLVVFSCILGASLAQRGSYAGSSPKGYPALASRFRDPNEPSTTVSFANRIGEDGTTARIPVDARGDGELVDRLNQWPREHRPFWLINAEHIEASRNSQGGGGLQNPTGNSISRTQGVNFNQQQQQSSDFQNTQSRSNFDEFDPLYVYQPETRPIRPVEQRSSFLGPRH